MVCELNQSRLRHFGQVGVAWHEAANALVGSLDSTLLSGCTGVAEPATCTNAIFQSPEAGKLGAAIKGEALTCEGWQRRESFDDLVHDRTRVPALVLDHHGVAAFALDQ